EFPPRSPTKVCTPLSHALTTPRLDLMGSWHCTASRIGIPAESRAADIETIPFGFEKNSDTLIFPISRRFTTSPLRTTMMIRTLGSLVLFAKLSRTARGRCRKPRHVDPAFRGPVEVLELRRLL